MKLLLVAITAVMLTLATLTSPVTAQTAADQKVRIVYIASQEALDEALNDKELIALGIRSILPQVNYIVRDSGGYKYTGRQGEVVILMINRTEGTISDILGLQKSKKVSTEIGEILEQLAKMPGAGMKDVEIEIGEIQNLLLSTGGGQAKVNGTEKDQDKESSSLDELEAKVEALIKEKLVLQKEATDLRAAIKVLRDAEKEGRSPKTREQVTADLLKHLEPRWAIFGSLNSNVESVINLGDNSLITVFKVQVGSHNAGGAGGGLLDCQHVPVEQQSRYSGVHW